MNRPIFRSLIAAYVLSGVLTLVLGIAEERLLPRELRDVEFPSIFDIHPVFAVTLGFSLLAGVIVSTIGLLVFWNPSRYIFAATVFLAWVTAPLLGPSISPVYSGMAETASNMLCGAIIYMIFFTGFTPGDRTHMKSIAWP